MWLERSTQKTHWTKPKKKPKKGPSSKQNLLHIFRKHLVTTESNTFFKATVFVVVVFIEELILYVFQHIR